MDQVCTEIQNAPKTAAIMGGKFERFVDSIYLGGGTPTVLESAQLHRIFAAVRNNFDVEEGAEITVECAPGTLPDDQLEGLLRCGVNRVSLGVQSFVDQEAAAVGRLHKRETVLADIDRLRSSGISNLNIDLIAGLPHQTAESWAYSIEETIATNVPHVSVYMLEVDEDSRLGREVLAGGTRYHAHFVPDEEAMADFYLAACAALSSAKIGQYEISNFARAGFESRHNLKYWRRQPYFGFGVDAHSMLLSLAPDLDAVRFAPSDSLESYMKGADLQRTSVSREAALEESFFLGLRLTQGLDTQALASEFGGENIRMADAIVRELIDDQLMERHGDFVCLTSRGRLISNEVFERFLRVEQNSAVFGR